MFRKLVGALILLVVLLLCCASYGLGKSQVKMRPIPIEVVLLDGNGQPIRPSTGVQLYLTQFGGSPWDREYWVEIKGQPDERGRLKVTTNFPLDPVVTKRMYDASRNP